MIVKKFNVNAWEYISVKNKPPLCVKCKYVLISCGHWCERTGDQALNIITGEIEVKNSDSCHNQRFNEGVAYCGISGKFFEKSAINEVNKHHGKISNNF